MRGNWKVKKIKDVCQVIAGQSPESKYYNKIGDGFPFYQGKKEFTDKFIGKPTTWTTKVTKKAQKGDILMSVRAPVGPVNFSGEDICIGRGLAAIRASDLVDKEYLFYFLQKNENEIVGNAGAVFNSINKAQIENIIIPVPPLLEQQQIVVLIEEAFEAIDKAKENTDKNLQNAKELFDSYIQKNLDNPGKGWKEKTIQECFKVKSGDFLPAREMKSDGIIDVYGGNGIAGKHDIYNLTGENIIIGRVGEKCGNVRLVRGNIWLTDNALYISQMNEEIDLRFLKYLLIHKNLRALANQTAQPVISYNTIKNVSLVFPSLIEQNNLVNKLESLTTEIQKLDNFYQQKLTDLEELKKSILQKAFNGEL